MRSHSVTLYMRTSHVRHTGGRNLSEPSSVTGANMGKRGKRHVRMSSAEAAAQAGGASMTTAETMHALKHAMAHSLGPAPAPSGRARVPNASRRGARSPRHPPD